MIIILLLNSTWFDGTLVVSASFLGGV